MKLVTGDRKKYDFLSRELISNFIFMETYKMLKKMYNNDTLLQMQSFEWHQYFRDGRKSVKDDKHTGHLQC